MYWADFLADTQHLSREDLGSYILLIGAYWRKGEPLPDDDASLRRICRVEEALWPDVRRTLAALFTVEAGLWCHKRIESELAKARQNRASASQRGRKGAAKKWLEHNSANGRDMAKASPSQWLNDGSSPSPSPIEYIPPSGVEITLPPGFPKSEQDAIARCMAIGVTDDFARDTYHKALSRGGKDAREVPIHVWPSYVKTEWKYQQNRTEEKKHENRNPANRGSHDHIAQPAEPVKSLKNLGKLV